MLQLVPVRLQARVAMYLLFAALFANVGSWLSMHALGQSPQDIGMQGSAVEQALLVAEPQALFDDSMKSGNAARGAILFHGPMLGCSKCHSLSESGLQLLGPNLALPREQETGAMLVDSLLRPDSVVAEEYRSVRVLTEDGQVLTGMLVEQDQTDSEQIVLRSLDTLRDQKIDRGDLERVEVSNVSVMPSGLVKALTNRAEFYDLVKYLVEIREGGARRARELQPTSAQLAIQLPEYESEIDHAGMIGAWDEASFDRGQAIYSGLCVNCHGTLEAPGSLATAMRFGEGKSKHGNDPYSMYQTLTRGAGLMLPQPWMVPQQKYDVIHYLRKHFYKDRNPSEYFNVEQAYLESLPKGDQVGPAPKKIEPWSQADYGPRLVNTYEIGRGGRNIAQKGIALQLDDNPGGVAHGRAWVVFDHDTMRVAGVWTSNAFIDWQGIHFNGSHNIHPHAVGDILLSNPNGPGWADPETGSIADDARVQGRDEKFYGPLPRRWAQYTGLAQVGNRTLIEYRVDESSVVETFDYEENLLAGEVDSAGQGVFLRHLRVGPRRRELKLIVATLDDAQRGTHEWSISDQAASVKRCDSDADTDADSRLRDSNAALFDGQRYWEMKAGADFDMLNQDFTIVADIRVQGDGTIFSRAPREGEWQPGGQTLFVRDGKLTYDVGWVGAARSNVRINDGRPHRVALTWRESTQLASLWVDGERVGKKRLKPKQLLEDAVFRIGRTSEDFPSPSTLDDANIDRIQLFQRELTPKELGPEELAPGEFGGDAPVAVTSGKVADWSFSNAAGKESIVDTAGQLVASLVDVGDSSSGDAVNGELLVGWHEHFGLGDKELQAEVIDGRLVLNLPVGESPMQFTVWSTLAASDQESGEVAAAITERINPPNLTEEANGLLNASQARAVYPEPLTTEVQRGGDEGGFAVDVLKVPTANPWQARVRPSGLDFFSDGDRMAVSTWDGDVWIVSGLSKLDPALLDPAPLEQAGETARLVWRRAAFGLFQPLGLKIIDDTIYLTCRDQLMRLEDRNDDGEFDYYRCVNNDHQVTEHFHEFAMGLQTDVEGNFYYAKSARHALPAIVPHHGTLLRVSADGETTEILANGFRAANGVCLNPDGSFIVTDQEGHWNPKNRINWVHRGGFYGNMYGYHDVTDESDSAMEQPLCWITNRFDRSPAELLWVNGSSWGPFEGTLLNLSYGYGKIYVVPHETVTGQVQGGMCQLPIRDFPTGTIRGRFSPFDGQLYLCGLSAWATSQTAEAGGLYRVRYTGQPAALPLGLSARPGKLHVTFSEALSPDTPVDPKQFGIDTWSLRRTKKYGSDHYDEKTLVVESVTLSQDRRTLTLVVPDIEPTWCMEVRMTVRTEDGRTEERIIHNTIHNLANES